ncbi:MAG: pyrroline-5-carboxylate reductase [Sneathiellales bacterium]|nr:pyrroline-5-carboxylate reductase [Sneathiellales bacterium]
MTMSVLLVGCGNMGRAMLGGWIEQNVKPNDILVVDPSTQNLELAAKTGCRIFTSPLLIEEGYQPDVIVLAVKPQVMEEVIPTYRNYVEKGALIISVAAGTRISLFEEYFGQRAAVIRTMPNTPAAVGRGMLVSCANTNVSAEQKSICDSLMSTIGTTAWVDREDLMDAVTGLSGSGPAYVFHMIEAMITAGIKAGLPEELATTMAKVTVAGAGELALSSTEDVAQLRKNVTSPNGTTAAGLDVLMENEALVKLMTSTVEAAKRRSEELR